MLADNPTAGLQARVAPTSTVPRATPKEAMPDCSISGRPFRCLNLATSFQTNLGAPASTRSECGSNPSFRDNENRSSALADTDASASSLHHVGQAAFMAGSLRPILLRRCLSRVALSVISKLFPQFVLASPINVNAPLTIFTHQGHLCIKALPISCALCSR